MRHDVIQAARNIPKQLQETVSAMFAESEKTLREAVGALKSSLAKVSAYVESIEVPRGKPGRKSGTAPNVDAPKATSRRTKGRFGISEYILNLLAQHPDGFRPVQIAEKLTAETGRDKGNALSNVNTTLSRLKTQGMAKSTEGIWTATGKSASATATKKVSKAGETAGRPRSSGRKTGKGSRAGAFAATEFILKAVTDSGEQGVRPRDIVAQIEQAAPGHHAKPSALVGTILTRLKKRGEVKKSAAGIWRAA